MTKNRQNLRRINSPIKSPRRHNSSLRKKALVRRISGEVQFGAASKANLKVVVRLRPQNQREDDKGARCVVDVMDEHMLVFDPKEDDGDGFFFKGTKQRCRDLSKRQPLEKKFAFERVFGDQATNAEVYEATAHPLVDTLLQGYNCCVFAYGATGAGKTFTMLGRPECPGITSLTLQELYQRLDELKGHRRCEVAVSYLEVYNETVRDLLGTGKPLALQEMGQQVMVPGLSLHKPTSAEELLQMLAQGNSNRTQHATDANAESSRSHAVFQIFVRQQDLDASVKATVTISKLSMIDLAGSERGAATGYRGVRFKEGSSINKSLLALGNCINALADGQRHIPYRDSKLTRLLKDSLGGNCRSVMIAAMSPASTSFEDTYNTLRYAERAKTIRTTIRNNVKNVDQHVSDYIKVVAGLREEVASLREKLKEYQEKEEKWEAQRSELAAAAAAAATTTAATPPPPATPVVATTTPPSTSSQEMEVEKQMEEEISEEEAEAQRQLQDIIAEQKALRWELLQQEAAYKATELKRHYWVARLARVQVVAFASCKLDKTLKKCERTIHTLDTRLSQTAQRIHYIEGKIAANLAKMQEAQHSNPMVEKHKASIAVRDGHQLGEHLQSLLREDFKEQHTSEQLVHVLLGAVRDFYLQFHQKEQCCGEVRNIFQRVVDGLDECRIAWADQQCVAEEEGGQAPAGSRTVLTPLDANHFIHLPSLTPAVISPTVMVEPTTSFRKSSMMATVSASVLPHCQPAGDSRTSVANATSQPRPVSHPHTPPECQPPENTGEEKGLCITTTPPSPVLHFQGTQPLKLKSVDDRSSVLPTTTTADLRLPQETLPVITSSSETPAKSLNTTFDSDPTASRLSSLTITAPTRILNTTIDIPNSASASRLSTITIPNFPLSPGVPDTIRDPPSASKLSSVSISTTPTRILNATVDVSMPLVLSPHTTTSITPLNERRLSMAYSDTKLLRGVSCAPQLSPTNAHLMASSQVSVPVTSVLPSSAIITTTTTVADAATSALGPAVARQLFTGERAALNSTFSIAQNDISEEPSICPQPADCGREASVRSSTSGLKSTTGRSPLAPVSQRASHSNLLSIPEKQPVKPPFVRSFRGMANRRGLSRTPHKPLVQPYTPGKTVGKVAGMRRSVSTPSLISQQPATRHPTTSQTTRKMKGFGGTFHRTTSFLKGKTTNQENVPPQPTRRPSAGALRSASPSSHSRSPGPLGKA